MKTAMLMCVGLIGSMWAVGISSAQTNSSAPPTTQTTRTVAIFVKNHADNVPDQKVSALEDLLTSHLTGQGFRVISRDDALNAVAGFANAGPNQGDPSLAGANLDKLMSNNTSALRLAQNLGADYIFMGAIDSFTTDNIQYDEGDVHTSVTVYKLVLTYKLLDSGAGSFSSDSVTAVKKERTQPGLQISHSDIVGDLMTDGAGQLADKLANVIVPVPPPVAADMVQFTVISTMADVIVPITTRNDNGDYSVSTSATVQIPATVELDGVAVGTSLGPLQGHKGIHKMRVSAAGFKDWNYTTNIYQGQQLNVALQLDDEGYQRWHESAAFLESLKDRAQLTHAEADKIEGIAQMFRNSGFKIYGAPAPTVNVVPGGVVVPP